MSTRKFAQTEFKIERRVRKLGKVFRSFITYQVDGVLENDQEVGVYLLDGKNGLGLFSSGWTIKKNSRRVYEKGEP